jgi:mRNA-degrading endonuclease RelE of RelBE toxin-antitoxin system
MRTHVLPAARNCTDTKIGGEIRVGNYRVVYAIDDDQKVVDITRIAHRKDAYE